MKAASTRPQLTLDYPVAYYGIGCHTPTRFRFRLYHASGWGTLGIATELPENRGIPLPKVDLELKPDHRLAHCFAVGLDGHAFYCRPTDDCFLFLAHRPKQWRHGKEVGERFVRRLAVGCDKKCELCSLWTEEEYLPPDAVRRLLYPVPFEDEAKQNVRKREWDGV